MHQLIQQIEKEHILQIQSPYKKDSFHVGDDIIVNIKIPDKKITDKITFRIQKFIGRCIWMNKINSTSGNFKVLQLEGTKVMRIFPLYSPMIDVQVKTLGYVRKAKLNYLIPRTGKALRIRIKKIRKIKKTPHIVSKI